MNVNATLIVQAVNFCIAYLLFRFIFLKPSYAAIVQDRKDQARWEGVVDHDKQELQLIHDQRKAQWISCQQTCKKYETILPNKADIFRGIMPAVSVRPLSSKEQKLVVDRLSKSMVNHTQKGMHD